jgi:hypothetical protein
MSGGCADYEDMVVDAVAPTPFATGGLTDSSWLICGILMIAVLYLALTYYQESRASQAPAAGQTLSAPAAATTATA